MEGSKVELLSGYSQGKHRKAEEMEFLMQTQGISQSSG